VVFRRVNKKGQVIERFFGVKLVKDRDGNFTRGFGCGSEFVLVGLARARPVIKSGRVRIFFVVRGLPVDIRKN
jgi:hypothetical protein